MNLIDKIKNILEENIVEYSSKTSHNQYSEEVEKLNILTTKISIDFGKWLRENYISKNPYDPCDEEKNYPENLEFGMVWCHKKQPVFKRSNELFEEFLKDYNYEN